MRARSPATSRQRLPTQPIGYQPVMLMPQQQQPVMMQPVYQYVPRQQASGGIYNKMRQTKQLVSRAATMPSIEQRVLLPNGRSIKGPQQRQGQPRSIEDRLIKPVGNAQNNQQKSQLRQQASKQKNQQTLTRRQQQQTANQGKKTLRLNPQSKGISKQGGPLRSKANAAVSGKKQTQSARLSTKKASIGQQSSAGNSNQKASVQNSTAKKQDGLPMLGKNIVLPQPNPIGNPYERPQLAKINDENELKGLQVKAELNKLQAPSRSFSEYLLLDPSAQGSNDNAMQDCAALGGPARKTMNERFSRIEKARPAVHPVTIQLARKLRAALNEREQSHQPAGAANKAGNQQKSQNQNTSKKTQVKQKQSQANARVQSQRAARRQNRHRK